VCRHRNKLAAAAAALLAVVLAASAEQKIGYRPDPASIMAHPAALFAGFVLLAGLLQAAAPALVLAMAITTARQGVGPWAHAARFLSAPAFLGFADITYDIYLLHPLVCCLLPLSCLHACMCVQETLHGYPFIRKVQ
jgi:peptidoglycan/LPS O-acetylase OafA/YrhL